MDVRLPLDTATEITPEILGVLRSEYEHSITDDNFAGRVARADELRFALWDGQSEDGRKHEDDLGETPFPFEGAADVRIRLVDDLCRFVSGLFFLSFVRSSLGVEGSSTNAQELGAVRKYLHQMVFVKLYSALVKELGLHANNIVTYGWGVLHFDWDRQKALRPRRITTEMLAAFPEFQDVADIPGALESKQDLLVELMRGHFGLEKKEAKRIVRELIEDGSTEIAVEELVKDQPCVTALRPYRDIVFPTDTSDLQDARVIFRREWVSEAELRAIAEEDGWDEQWLEDVVDKTKGKSLNPESLDVRTSDFDFWGDGEVADKYEVVYAYHRAVKDGISGVYLTVFSPNLETEVDGSAHIATSRLMTDAENKYPFLSFTMEDVRRAVVESRGIPDIVKTWEYEIATQLNSVIDRSTFDTFPPYEVPLEYAEQLIMQPGAQLSVYNRGDVGFMDPPKREPTVAFELMDKVELRADRYFGRPSAAIPPDLTTMTQQVMIARWTAHAQEIIKRIWEQAQRYETDEQFARIVGVPGARISRDMLTPAVEIDFDVKSLNSELTLKTLETLATSIAPLDTNGVIDRSEAVRLAIQYLDPALARRIALDNAGASQQIFNQVRDEVLQMSAGNQPQMQEEDPAAGAKLQALQTVVQQNPVYGQRLAQPSQGDPFPELMAKYEQHLQFQVQQHQLNPQIGRLGVDPNATEAV